MNAIYHNADFNDSDLLFHGQVSIQRLQENNDKRYGGITIVIFTLHVIELASNSVVFYDGVFFLSNNICREEEDCEDAKPKANDRSLRTYLSNGEIDTSSKCDSSEVRFHSLRLGA